MEVVVLLFGLACLLIFFIGPLLGVIAFFSLRELRNRLDRLEERLAQVAQDDWPVPQESVPPPPTPPSVEPRHAELGTEPQAAASPAGQPDTTIDALPFAPRVEPFAWESLLGARVLGWVAAAFLLLAFGYFITYAFQNEWIGPVGQVCLGLLAGLLLCVAGARVHRRGYLMGTMLLGTGIVLLYLSVFASYGGYQLIPASRGVLYQLLLVALSVGLAGTYQTRSLALMALVGGLVSPALVPAERDLYGSFFAYLLLLEAAMIVLSQWRGWCWLPPLALIGVQILFNWWAEANYHPEKLAAVLGFQATLFGLHLLHDVGVPLWLRHPAPLSRLVGLVVATIAFAQAVVVYPYGEIRPWLPLLSLGLAMLMVLLAKMVKRRIAVEREPLYFTLLAVGLVFVAAAPALRFTASWIGLAWAILGLLLWAYAVRVEARPLAVFAAVLLVLAVIAEVPGYLSQVGYVRNVVMVPIFNPQAMPPTLVVFAWWLAAWQLRSVQG
ncbi:MAG: DUF2339 domain-containing protein, partial [Gemmataceae bacterium]